MDALIEADEIGAGVQARLVSGLCEHTGQHRAGRTLAVRAGNVDEFELFLRVAEQAQQLIRAGQARLALLPVVELQIFEGLVDGLQFFHIVHLYFL